MSISTANRRGAKIVAVTNLFLAVTAIIAFGIWLGFYVKINDLGDLTNTDEGRRIIFLTLLVLVGVVYESCLAVVLLHAVVKENYRKVKAWFLTQTICLPIVTLAFLFNLANPRVPILPFFLLVLIKSISLWIVSQLYDEIYAEEHHQQTRLISPFDPPEED